MIKLMFTSWSSAAVALAVAGGVAVECVDVWMNSVSALWPAAAAAAAASAHTRRQRPQSLAL